jgi:hypothetical protein
MKPLKKIYKFLFLEWNEFISIPLGLMLFFWFPKLLRYFDNTAAAYDAGVLHSFIIAISGMLIIHGFAWLLLKITFPGIYNFFDNIFESHINSKIGYNPYDTPSPNQLHNSLSIWQKCVLSLSLFSVYLLGTILLARIF